MKQVVAQLEERHDAINRALAALREVEGARNERTASAPAGKKRGMTPEGKKRLIAALKRYWANKRKAAKA